MKPVFKKKEVVIKYPEKDAMDLGATKGKETVAKILYVGEAAENYKVGDTILFTFAEGFGKEINYFGERLFRIENESHITCQVVED